VVVVVGGGGFEPPAVAWTTATSVSALNRSPPAEANGPVVAEPGPEKLRLAFTPSKAVKEALVAPDGLTVVLA
jgi:hypothetical protein